MARPIPKFYGYVRIDLASRFPRRWRWKVCKEGTEATLATSEEIFVSPDDAWGVAQQVLLAFERGDSVEGADVLADAE